MTAESESAALTQNAAAGARPFSPNWLLIAVGFAVFLGALDQTVVVTLLEPILNGVNVPIDQFYRAAWIVNGYILGYVVAMPLMGRIADVYGHSRVFLVALAIFLIGSLWVSACQGLTMLIVARAVQALGAGALVPVSMAIVAEHVPAERRALSFGLLGAAAEGGGLLGPLWGGSLVELLGWRGHFWINVPLALPVAFVVLRFSRDKKHERVPVDYVGGILLAGALTTLAVALTDDPVAARPVWVNVALYISAAACMVAFIWRERVAKTPMLALSLFRSVVFAAGNFTHMLMGGGLIVAMVSVPIFTIVILDGSYFLGGLNLMRLTVMLPVGAVAGGYLAGWIGYHRTAAIGMAISGVGFFFMHFWTADIADPWFTLNLMLTGLGFGLVIAPISAAVINSVAEQERATASALLTVMRLVGMLVGVALLTAHGLGHFYQLAGTVPLDDPNYTETLQGLEVGSFQDIFLVAAIVCVAASVPAILIGRGVARRFKWTEIWRAPH
ncbi:MAG: MFS transporter [Dehalococcoidia bacterium]|nr:MFS transporter [Dehalococcoidia bacterium]